MGRVSHSGMEPHPTSVTCRCYLGCLVWHRMPLRCLLFSSHEEMVQPIWQALADLGIEGEYCPSAVDAVERVTTQMFQIVITDWDDQPEAAFLLKTARDQKAAHRPLSLAIVSDDAKLPEALKAGANSVLLKPIRLEQVRDTLGTACELLRSKQPITATPAAIDPTPPAAPASFAAAASATAAPAPVPPSIKTQPTEKTFRAGEFLQTPNSSPGAQFDTECEVQKSLEKVAPSEIDALTELEPMASAVTESPAAEPADPQKALAGWASLQARLTKSAPQPPATAASQNELLGYGDMSSDNAPAPPPPAAKKSAEDASHEAALFAYMEGDASKEAEAVQEERRTPSKIFLLAGFVLACVVLAAVPQTRNKLPIIYRNTLRAAETWLNPRPAPPPQTVTQHETFGQAGDEYKLPANTNIPDATTDPSEIHVVPVIDPTAKTPKGSDAGTTQTTANENATDQAPSSNVQNGQPQIVESQAKDQLTTPAPGQTVVPPQAVQAQPTPASDPIPVRQQSSEAPVPTSTPPHSASAVSNTTIPSSLKSQTASMTPESSGAKPVEAAMSSIEPVTLPESEAWNLLALSAEPVYPEAAKANNQKGSVALQVLIGHDGTVEDAKFLQGSLVFARAAIDAVKQWHFKPYLMNGRPVSVQTVITLNFKPPA